MYISIGSVEPRNYESKYGLSSAGKISISDRISIQDCPSLLWIVVCGRLVLNPKTRLASVLDEVFQPLRRRKTACRFSNKLSAGNTNKLGLVLPGTIRPGHKCIHRGAYGRRGPLYVSSANGNHRYSRLSSFHFVPQSTYQGLYLSGRRSSLSSWGPDYPLPKPSKHIEVRNRCRA